MLSHTARRLVLRRRTLSRPCWPSCGTTTLSNLNRDEACDQQQYYPYGRTDDTDGPIRIVRPFSSTTTDRPSDATRGTTAATATDNPNADDSGPTPTAHHSADTTDPPPSSTSSSSVRTRLQTARGQARDHYDYVRDHPGASARSAGAMMRQYGPVFVGTYLTVYLSTLGSLFAGVQIGLMDPVVLFSWLGQDGIGGGGTAGETASTVQVVVEFMQAHSWSKPYSHVIENNPAFANLAVSWIAVKFTEPLRLPLSIALTPRVARYFGYRSSVVDPEVEEVKSAEEVVDAVVEADRTKDNEKVVVGDKTK